MALSADSSWLDQFEEGNARRQANSRRMSRYPQRATATSSDQPQLPSCGMERTAASEAPKDEQDGQTDDAHHSQGNAPGAIAPLPPINPLLK